MLRIILISLFMLTALGAAAQQYPDRRQVRKGNRAYEKQDYPAAADRYRQALTVNPLSFEARYNLGNTLYRQQQYGEAEKALQQSAADSLTAPADRAHAFYNLGNAQFQQKKYKEALESYRNALRLNPDDMEAKFNYAYVKKLLDDQQNDQNQQNQDNQNNQGEGQQNPQQDQQQQQDPQQGKDDSQQGGNDQQQDQSDPSGEGRGTPQQAGISQAEQERMLDAIQAQEDRTQEKLKEKAGVVVRLKKNW